MQVSRQNDGNFSKRHTIFSSDLQSFKFSCEVIIIMNTNCSCFLYINFVVVVIIILRLSIPISLTS